MAVQDPLDGVSTFVQVVEAGGFTSAAERIGVTRSAVGKAVARLETRLGTRLLQRNTRSQTLTEEGQITRGGKSLGVFCKRVKGRWEVRNLQGLVVFSGHDLGQFVERFWYWEPKDD